MGGGEDPNLPAVAADREPPWKAAGGSDRAAAPSHPSPRPRRRPSPPSRKTVTVDLTRYLDRLTSCSGLSQGFGDAYCSKPLLEAD